MTRGIFHKNSGFALPTVLIVSVILMITGTAILQGSLASKAALENQYYESIAREAAEAGLSRARSCFNQGTETWASLMPNIECGGEAINSPSYVFKNNKIESTFVVSTPTEGSDGSWRATSLGTVSLIRSDGSKWVLAEQSLSQTINSYGYYSVENDWAYSSESVSKISADGSHTCAIAKGKAYCWGANNYGQLGNNSTALSTKPVPVDTSGVLGGKIVTDIATGAAHTCALAEGKVYCWGYNYYGQLGNGTTSTTPQTTPIEVGGLLNGKQVTTIGAGGSTTCAIADGKAYCWGYNGNGGVGDNSTTTRSSPVAVYSSGALSGKTVTSISPGSTTCAIAEGKAYCWGAGSSGQLGNSSNPTSQTTPVAVSNGEAGASAYYTQIETESGASHTCGVASGKAYCWGANNFGQLGRGSTTSAFYPVKVVDTGVLSGKTVTKVSIGQGGQAGSCALADGSYFCWGGSAYGRYANPSAPGTSNVPVAMSESSSIYNKYISDITVATLHACGIVDRKAYCWGTNSISPTSQGMLGSGDTSYAGLPRPVFADDVPAPVIIY